MSIEIRRTLLWQQITYLEGWKKVEEPTLLVAAMARYSRTRGSGAAMSRICALRLWNTDHSWEKR